MFKGTPWPWSIMARMDVSTQSAVILSPVMGRYVTFQGLMLAVKWLFKNAKNHGLPSVTD